jgi:hypothetical protein
LYKNDVNDKSTNIPGVPQHILTLDGFIIPLSIKDGIACLYIHLYKDHEWDTLEIQWDPSVLEDEQCGEAPELESLFDEIGDYKNRVVIVQHLAYLQRQDSYILDDVIDHCDLDAQVSQRHHAPDKPTFYDAHQTELDVPPKDSLPGLTPSGPKDITKRDPDYYM